MTRNIAAQRGASPYWTFSLVAVAVVLVVALPLIIWLQFTWLWAYLIGINVATFALYAYDKRVASGSAMRIPERILHLCELLGGTPAGFAGQRVFHHKSRKTSYQIQFWVIVAVQVIVVVLLWHYGLA